MEERPQQAAFFLSDPSECQHQRAAKVVRSDRTFIYSSQC